MLPQEWPLPRYGALLTLIQSASFQGGICAFAGLSAGLPPGIVQLWGRVSECAPAACLKRKECVRNGHVVDSDAIKET